MTIKSLLLGSAAALVAVSGARAADAIVAEPEPVEYVRVCDAYGAGFFYIPGTETCLRIGGEVRVQVGGSEYGSLKTYTYPVTGPTVATALAASTTYSTLARARLFWDARSDTELGTLRGYVRVDFNRGHDTLAQSIDGVYLNHGYIELGGFKVGFTDSTWVTFAGFGSHSDSGLSYGYQQRNLASYTFSGNGFSATIAVEDDGSANYTPDFVGGVAYSGGWGRAFAQAGYDETAAGWGGAAGLTINVPNAPGSSFIVKGYYASNGAVAYSVGSEWSVLASYGHQFNSKFFASVGVQYLANLASAGAFTATDAFVAELNVVYTPVENFVIRGEVTYTNYSAPGFLPGVDESTLAGFLRFSRFF